MVHLTTQSPETDQLKLCRSSWRFARSVRPHQRMGSAPSEMNRHINSSDATIGLIELTWHPRKPLLYSHRAIARRTPDRVIDLVSQFVFAHLMQISCQ